FIPKQDYTLLIQFDTNEAQAEELSEIIDLEFQKIAKEGPLTEDIEKTREYLAKEWKNGLETNATWAANIDKFYNTGLDYTSNYETILKNITNEDIQKFAQKILADGNMVHVVMRPEAAAAAETK
ncbi:MAG: insulinase family protein, partial [Alistipes sp.]